MEIGPGAGFLTASLLKTGRTLTAIEIDPKMIRELTALFGENPAFRLIHQDILQVDLLPLVQPKGIVVGNIPYHLTGPILFKITGELGDNVFPLRPHLEKVVLMVQKEVGDRLVAKPGEKAYSQLTLQVQYWFETSPVVFVPKSAFFPSPKVDSLVVALTPRSEPAVQVDDSRFFSRLIKACFLHRRKTLFNNLKIGSFGSPEQISEVLASLGLTMNSRPQELSMQQFGALANALCANG